MQPEQANGRSVQQLQKQAQASGNRFTPLIHLAQRSFGVPIVLIHLGATAEPKEAIVQQGLSPTALPLTAPFITQALADADLCIIPDLQADSRYQQHPLVAATPHLRFYAAQPLRDQAGNVSGMLALFDTNPREFTPADQQLLADLGTAVEREHSAITIDAALAEQHESDVYLRALMANIGDGIVTFDASGKIESTNYAVEEIFGYAPHELVEGSIWSLLPQAYPDEPVAGLLRGLIATNTDERRGGRQQNCGFRRNRRARCRDGSVFPAELTVSTMQIAGEQRYIATIRDVSERYAAANALQISRVRLEAILTHIPVVLFSTDPEGMITLAEGQPMGTTIRPPETVVGESLFALLRAFPDSVAQARQTLTGATCPPTTMQINQSSFQMQMAPLRSDQGDVVGLIGVANDITERVQAEQELHKALAALSEQYRTAEQARGEARAVLDATSEGMALVGPDRRFITINRRFADMFALLPDDVIGRHFEEFSPLVARVYEDPAAFTRLVSGTAEDSERQFTALVNQRWPETRELQLFSTPVRTIKNNFLGRLYVLRDVTRERQVERMKSEFISMVSHELRTPMTSIKGFVDLLLEGEVGEITAEQQEFLEIVQTNTDRLIVLINDLLDVSRVESGRMTLQRQALDYTRIVRGVVSTVRTQVEAKKQTLTVTIPDNLPYIAGDPNRVTQIILNLLTNAHKYTPEHGQISLEVTVDGAMLRTTVQDTGIGLTLEDQAQLFTKFFRASNRATQQAGGTGLGLALSRSLVEMHGGEIAVFSKPGEGATFSFTLPIDTEQIPVAPLASPKRWGKQILLVEPSPEISNLLYRYLEREGYQVSTAADQAEVGLMIEAQRPDLLILDLDTPDGPDFTTFAQLRANPTTSDIPILVLSIHNVQAQGLALGAAGALMKPVEQQELLDQAHLALNSAASDVALQRVVVADADLESRVLLAGGLRWGGYEVIETADGASTLAACQQQPPDLLLLASQFPDQSGLAILQQLRDNAGTNQTNIIMLMADPEHDEANREQFAALGATLQPRPTMTPLQAATLTDHQEG